MCLTMSRLRYDEKVDFAYLSASSVQRGGALRRIVTRFKPARKTLIVIEGRYYLPSIPDGGQYMAGTDLLTNSSARDREALVGFYYAPYGGRVDG